MTPLAIARARVLIVEDENIVARDLAQTLASLGYTVLGTAASGEEALELAARQPPDLVLMDIHLRGEMDGTQAAEILHARHGVPVVFLTAHADEATLRRARETAPYGYVLKPFEERELSIALTMALAKHAAFEELEERVAARTAELAEAVRFRDEFLLVAAHELRTPLTALKLQLHGVARLAERGGADEPVKQRLAASLRSTERLASLVERLLDVSLLEAGMLTLASDDTTLADVAREVVETMEPEAERAGSRLTLTVAAPAAGVWDRARLVQVVTALVANALKYGGGKPVAITVDETAAGGVLEVEDHGIGIAPDALGRIFERFERAASSRNYGGLGLGLYVARQIVSAHGGTLAARSREGAGATFRLELPRAARLGRGATA